jgi:hypothetical protein
MRKRWRLALYLALLGFVFNVALFAYCELTDNAPFHPVLGIVSDILCPASFIGGLFFDFFDGNAHSGPVLAAWTFLGILNSAIYLGVGLLVGSFLWRSDAQH